MDGSMTPDLFTTDYTGEPGQRAFFLQARTGAITSTLAIEKQQVQVLAERLHEMLVAIDKDDPITGGVPARDPALAADPRPPEWRVGSIALGYDESNDLLLLVIEEITAEDDLDDQPLSARYSLRRDQVRSFVLHALAVVEEGRPLCQLCGLPKGPGGHQCPASNGHRLTV